MFVYATLYATSAPPTNSPGHTGTHKTNLKWEDGKINYEKRGIELTE